MSNLINDFKSINLPINVDLVSSAGHYVPPYEFGIKGRGAYDYEWIFVIACLFAFFAAAGIGANDVANSFATSVGSKTLKMWQAVIIAGICEFFGAYLLGARVTSTIKSGIVDIKTFQGHDDLLMIGMCCAVLTLGIFLFWATSRELPVSTTHTIIGAIIGFGLCTPSGGNAILWNEVGMIVASWFISPLLAAVVSGVIFSIVRALVLRHDNFFDRVFLFFPIVVFITITINVIFVLYKGGLQKGNGISGASVTLEALIGIAFGCGGGLALIVLVLVNPRLKRYIRDLSEEDLLLFAASNGNYQLSEKDANRLKELQAERLKDTQAIAAEGGADGKVVDADSASIESSINSWRKVGKVEAFFDRIFRQNYVHAQPQLVPKVQQIHDSAEIFPLKAEFAFGYLQVATACFASFAHGSNDVANSIGPLAAIYTIYTNGVGSAAKNSPVEDWILVLGGAGLVFGLAVYGHVIIAAMGVKLVKITPARGFCAELAVAFVITIGSFLGLPLSSTHTAVGAIMGLGVAERRKDAVNWRLFGKVFAGWVFTLIFAGTVSAAIFSWTTFSPSQIYPLSKHNCIAYYGQVRNVTEGDPSSYTINVNSGGTLAGFYGYPSDGTITDI